MQSSTHKKVIELQKMRRQIGQLARIIRPGLFHKVRLGYGIWHTLAVAGKPLTPEEIFDALNRGRIFTTSDNFAVSNIYNALRYHTKVGKLRYVGHEHWTIA